MSTEGSEGKNRNIGLVVSSLVHITVLLLFLFLTAWKAPYPPIPKYGIELKFGLDDLGGPEEPNEPTQEIIEDIESLEEEEPVIEEPVEEEEPLQETEEISPLDNPTEAPNPEPTVVEKKKEKIKNEVKKSKEAPLKKAKPKKRKPNPKATYTKPVQKKVDKSKVKKNYGNDLQAQGDQGNKKGVLDSKALYGNQGGGVGLDLAGWNWDEIPKPSIPDNESGGKIEFEIKVDSDGEIIGYRVLERSLSIKAERACREAISQLTFTKKTGATVPTVSVGKITFVVRTR